MPFQGPQCPATPDRVGQIAAAYEKAPVVFLNEPERQPSHRGKRLHFDVRRQLFEVGVKAPEPVFSLHSFEIERHNQSNDDDALCAKHPQDRDMVFISEAKRLPTMKARNNTGMNRRSTPTPPQSPRKNVRDVPKRAAALRARPDST